MPDWTTELSNRVDRNAHACQFNAVHVLADVKTGAHVFRWTLDEIRSAIADLESTVAILREAEAIQEQRMQEHLQEKAA